MADSVADKKKAARRTFHLGTYTTVLAVVWTAIIGVSLAWNLHEQESATRENAHTHAHVRFDADVLYRRWNAMHGGVYVPVTEAMSPNPYLDVPERDIETPAGQTLTLVNPAYMTRQVHELGAQTNGIQSHITSLDPLRPENAADPWETAALEAFERGVTEHSSIEVFRGEPHLRLMRPLVTEKGCLKCHAAQGYQVGDVRGGISVSVPMAPLWATGHAVMISTAVWHGFFWVLGIGGIGLSYRHLGSQIRQRNQAEEQLQVQKEELVLERAALQAIFDASQVGMILVDEDTQVIRVNDVVVQLVGRDASELLGRQPGDGLCCVHAGETPEGCGHAPACGDCPVRNAVTQVLKDGRPIRNVEATLGLMVGDEEK